MPYVAYHILYVLCFFSLTHLTSELLRQLIMQSFILAGLAPVPLANYKAEEIAEAHNHITRSHQHYAAKCITCS